MRPALPLGLSKNHNQSPHISSPLDWAVYAAYKPLYDEQKCSSSAWLLTFLSHKIVFKSSKGELGRFKIKNSYIGSDEFPIFPLIFYTRLFISKFKLINPPPIDLQRSSVSEINRTRAGIVLNKHFQSKCLLFFYIDAGFNKCPHTPLQNALHKLSL